MLLFESWLPSKSRIPKDRAKGRVSGLKETKQDGLGDSEGIPVDLGRSKVKDL